MTALESSKHLEEGRRLEAAYAFKDIQEKCVIRIYVYIYTHMFICIYICICIHIYT